MKVSELRNYGVAFSDAEAGWPDPLKRKMARIGRQIVFQHLGLWQRLRFVWAFLSARRRAARLDLGALHARGMVNETFLAQQLEYIAMFRALAQVTGADRAVEIVKKVMDATAKEALLQIFPDSAMVRSFEDPLAAMREYFRVGAEACRRAGCYEITVVEDSADAIQLDMTWCVWLELARLMGVPAACLPNCHADDLVLPEYFRGLGIEFRRTETLARGGCRCDYRFTRMPQSRGPVPTEAGTPTHK